MNDEPAGESDPPEATSPADAHASPDDPDSTTPADSATSTADATDADQPATDDPSEYTTTIRTLDARVRVLWIARALIVGVFVGGVVSAILFGAAPAILWLGPVVFVVVAGLGVAHAILLYRSWRYEIREDSLLLDRGVLTKVKTVVPYVRVQHIDTSRGPIERAAGLSSLVVYTAGSRGADVTIPGLTPEEADDLQTRLKALAIESEGEDAV